ncbi:MAG: hypothetical protein H6718_34395 [Polyangiaceae bacterium]|nr:hypothetical protein [Myxococcales bacterium]MCB9590551.1 hypothetical protein [Polyangiaceae bacterium]MCB9608546.1 hypothetical protein [Polyangiaceae bacterium]
MADKLAMFGAATGYLKRHPAELMRVAKNAVALRFGLPLDALRWLAGQAKGPKAPKDVSVEAVPPGIRVAATITEMGATVRAGAVIFIDRVSLNEAELRFEIRLDDVTAKVLDDNGASPVATLLKSGALDLSKPGNLAAFMPKRPAMLVEAQDDRIVLDFMKHPAIDKSAKLKAMVAALTALGSVKSIETDWDHLDLAMSAFPRGFNEALASIRRVL